MLAVEQVLIRVNTRSGGIGRGTCVWTHLTRDESMSRLNFTLAATGMAYSLLHLSPARAQGSEAPAAGSAPAKKTERIEVTGSRIKRIEAEGNSPVNVIDREQIEKSGQTSVRDLLSSYAGTSTAFSGGGSSVAGGVSTVSLKGLGSNRTLVLVDGVRLPKHPELGAVDLNSIPMAAVERIDVLNQSAAAIYGSEAIGGVINIITRKSYEGSQVQVQMSQGSKKGGETRSVAGVVGINAGAFNSTLVVSLEQKDILYTRQRDFSRDRVSSIGSPGTYAATFQENGEPVTKFFPVEGCSTYALGADGSPLEDDRCPYNYNDLNTLLPETKKVSGLYNFSYELNSSLELTGKLIATQQKSRSRARPENNQGEADTIDQSVIDAMPQNRFDTLFPGFKGVKPTEGGVGLSLRLTDFGTSITKKQADLIGGNIGLKGSFAGEWEWKANLSSGLSRTKSESSNKFRSAVFKDLITTGTYIPWDVNRDLETIRSQVLTSSRYTEDTGSSGLEAVVSGQVGELAGGSIGLAISSGVLGETYKVSFDEESANLALANVAGSGGKGDRSITYAAVESVLPFSKGFELDLSARVDNYSDFGSAFNPQMAFAATPVDGLKFRGSIGTAFKAPTLDEVNGATGVSYNEVVDYQYCEEKGISRSDCEADITKSARQVKNLRRGNKDLTPEKSVVLGAGVIIQPIDAASLSLDYWKIKSKDLISRRELQELVDENDPLVQRDPATGLITEIDYPLLNLSKTQRSGIDTNLTLRENLAGVTTSYKAIGTWYLEDKIEPKNKPMEDKLGENGSYKWKLGHELDFDWQGAYGITFNASTIGTHQKSSNKGERLPQYTRYDAQARYMTPWRGDIALGVNNILNKQGGIDSTSQGDVDADIYDIKGREYYLRVTQNF